MFHPWNAWRDGPVALASADWQAWLPLAVSACVLPFLLYSFRTNWLAREQRRLYDELNTASSRLRKARKKTTTEREENRLLRNFLAQPTAKRLAGVLMQRLVPRPNSGFAAIIQWLGDEQRLAFSRGLGDESRAKILLPAPLMERITNEPVVCLESQSLYNAGLLELLSPRDRGKVQRLMIVGAVEDGHLVCALISTDWFGSTVGPQRWEQLASRLVRAVGLSLLQERDAEIQKNQLRLTADMLQLRSITDRTDEAPAVMIQEYLSCLMHLLRSDRMAFFLGADSLVGDTNVVRCGENLPPGIAARWGAHEERLLDACRQRPSISTLTGQELQRAGVQSLVGSALVIPLVKDGRTIAHVCCTRRRRELFSASQRDLAAWAAEDFTHAMHRLLHHMATTRQARIDPLTELANRRVFDQRIEREWDRSRMTGEPCSLLMLDLDRFKQVNDTYGHQAGDFVLQRVSEQLRDRFHSIRKDDEFLLARYGGEELVVLLPGMPEDGALRVAESIRGMISDSEYRFQSISIAVTVSIGVATFPDHAKTVSTLISAADSALYFAKQSGRNRVRTAKEAPPIEAARLQQAESAIGPGLHPT